MTRKIKFDRFCYDYDFFRVPLVRTALFLGSQQVQFDLVWVCPRY